MPDTRWGRGPSRATARVSRATAVFGAEDRAGQPVGDDRGVRDVGSALPVKRRRDPVWARLLVVVGALLMVASGGGIAAIKYGISRYTANITQQNLLGAAASSGKSIDGPINLLLVGIDERLDSPADGARSDTIMILHIAASHDQAYLVSIPRDSLVQIPPFKQTGYAGGQDKINAAFEFGFTNNGGRSGGFQLLALTIQKLTGLTFNGGAIVNFDGFRSVVDAVGGVDMYVDEEVTSVHTGWNIKTGKEGPPYHLVAPEFTAQAIPGMRPQVYHPGWQHFAGWQALDYVRQRELIDDGDYGRQRHQQQFVKALAKKVANTGLANPIKLDSVLRASGKAVTFDGNGVPIEDWLFTLKDIKPSDVTMIKTNGGRFNTKVIGGQDFEILDDTSMRLFQAVRDDTVSAFVAANPTLVNADPTA